MPDLDEAESRELLDQAKTNWIMEIDHPVPLADAQSVDGAEHPTGWMISGAFYDDRDRAVSTLAYHERKHGPDKQRLIRMEVRYFLEEVPAEELQVFHDKAAKADAERLAPQQVTEL